MFCAELSWFEAFFSFSRFWGPWESLGYSQTQLSSFWTVSTWRAGAGPSGRLGAWHRMPLAWSLLGVGHCSKSCTKVSSCNPPENPGEVGTVVICIFYMRRRGVKCFAQGGTASKRRKRDWNPSSLGRSCCPAAQCEFVRWGELRGRGDVPKVTSECGQTGTRLPRPEQLWGP